MKNNNEKPTENTNGNRRSKIDKSRITIRVAAAVSERLCNEILFEFFDVEVPLPSAEKIDQIDLLLVIDHSDKSGGQNDE